MVKSLVFNSIFILIMLFLVLAIPSIANAQYECTYHAYRDCNGGNVYWFSSCAQQQDLERVCTNGLTCQYGQCTTYVQPIQPIQPTQTYNPYYRIACYGGSIHWFDSLGAESGLYKNCVDSNSCTINACSSSKCVNTLKCDGSTCAVGSADYNAHCAPAQTNTTVPPNTTTQPNTTVQPNNTNPNATPLPTSFSVRQSATAGQWQKTAEIKSNSSLYFMISVVNSSSANADNVTISTNIPTEISYLGDLKLDGITISGDIVTGINIGSMASANTRIITFEGRTQTISGSAEAPLAKQAIATSNNSGATQSDSITINFVSDQAVAAVAAAAATSAAEPKTGFWDFVKHWYLWILAGLVVIFLFVIVYKRFSSDV